MNVQKTPVLTALFSEVLADVAFLFPDEGAAAPMQPEPWLETHIEYRGPEQGQLRLRCPRAFARLLTANLLGVDADSDEAETKAEDAVAEFMNILCGHYVTTLFGTGSTFDLSIPRTAVLEGPPADEPIRDESSAATFVVRGYCVHLAHLDADSGDEAPPVASDPES